MNGGFAEYCAYPGKSSPSTKALPPEANIDLISRPSLQDPQPV